MDTFQKELEILINKYSRKNYDSPYCFMYRIQGVNYWIYYGKIMPYGWEPKIKDIIYEN